MDFRQLFSSFAVLLAFFAAGEGIVRFAHLAIPGSVVGMVLLTVCLVLGWIEVRRVQQAADLLLSQLGLLFVPPAVAVTAYFDLIAREWPALLVAAVGSLVAVLAVTAAAARLLEKRTDHG